MRKLTLLFTLAAIATLGVRAENPVAAPKATVTSGNARFTVLTPQMVRIEYSDKAAFEEKPTFTVINRRLDVPRFKTKETADSLFITTDALRLAYRKGADIKSEPTAVNITMSLNGSPIKWHPTMTDSLNLGGTMRTLDRYDGCKGKPKLEPGLVSRSGWAVIDDSPGAVRPDGSRSLAFGGKVNGIEWMEQRTDPDALDLYFMGYGHDYRRALHDYTMIAGKQPLPPVYVLGYWYSKYDDYSADEYREIISELKRNDINTDVVILDMDWHWNGNPDPKISNGRGGWTGWTWNTNLIPDPEGLLADIHKAGHRAALNLHPADGIAADEDHYNEMCADLGLDPAAGKTIPWQLEDSTFYKSFFNHIMRERERQGVDFWWLDWQQHLTSKFMPGLGETFWCNHVYFNDMKSNRPDVRPVIFHRWGGLGSHRYQIGFSGDTYINYPTLAWEPYFTATASNVGYGYWGHDLGGHLVGNHDTNDPELLTRWMQFGVFTPIFRTHASMEGTIERRIWKYDDLPVMNKAVKLRYRLMPYIYTMARKSYDTGISICRPLYYDYPENDMAYSITGQYFFGDDILVAPVTEPGENRVATKSIWLPEGEWYCPDLGEWFKGDTTISRRFALDQIPYFVRRGAIITANTPDVKRANSYVKHLVLDVYTGADGNASLYEDSGNSNDYATRYAATTLRQQYRNGLTRLTVSPRQGDFDGAPASRSYTVNLYTQSPLTTAKVNGKSVDIARISPTQYRLTIPMTKVDKALKIEVR